MLPEISAFFVSASALGFAELGDKTQFLAITLAARFRKPVPIILGIFAATLLNNAAVAALGQWITGHISADVLRWVVGISLIIMAGVMLLPEKEGGDVKLRAPSLGVFITAFMSFFLAELADKTQLATMALSARYATSYWAVVAGTTFGMMAVNIPAVLLGEKATKVLPMKYVKIAAALIYAVSGVVALLSHTSSLPISPAS